MIFRLDRTAQKPVDTFEPAQANALLASLDRLADLRVGTLRGCCTIGYLRKLLVVGATAVIRRARGSASASAPWIRSLLEPRPARVVTVAMADKTPRIARAVLARNEVYRAPAIAGPRSEPPQGRRL